MAKGFNRAPALGGGQAGMLQKIQRLQKQMEDAQALLAQEIVTVTTGGGAIKLSITGDQKCQSITIDPEFLKDAEAEMLQDMLLTAFNMALDQARELQQQKMGPLAGGLPF